MIESGLIFLNKLFELKLINNLYIFKSSKNLNINGFNNISSNFIKKLKFDNKIRVNLENDELFKVRIK